MSCSTLSCLVARCHIAGLCEMESGSGHPRASDILHEYQQQWLWNSSCGRCYTINNESTGLAWPLPRHHKHLQPLSGICVVGGPCRPPARPRCLRSVTAHGLQDDTISRPNLRPGIASDWPWLDADWLTVNEVCRCIRLCCV